MLHSLLLCALLPLVARAQDHGAQAVLSDPNQQTPTCDSLSCDDPTITVIQGSTTIYQPITSDPSAKPDGFPNAALIGTTVDANGSPYAKYVVSDPTTFALPKKTLPASWYIASTTISRVVAPGLTAVETKPVMTAKLTSVPSCVPVTTTSTTTEVQVQVQTQTETQTVKETFTEKVDVPGPTQTVEVTSTQSVTTTQTVETTKSIPYFITETETTTNYVTLPPVTSFSTVTSTSTSISISVPPPVTSFSTTTSTVTSTSISISVPPAVTSTATETTTVTSTSISISVLPAVTTTATVEYCPPRPTCNPGTPKPWTKFEAYIGKPTTLTVEDDFPTVFRVVDLGWKMERFEVSIDGAPAVLTSSIGPTYTAAYCGYVESAVNTCVDMDFSRGSFFLSPGKHTISVTNVPFDQAAAGKYTPSAYTTALYSTERVCSSAATTNTPSTSCTVPPAPLVPWTKIDVYENAGFNLTQFNYPFPVKITVVDVGYNTERLQVVVDDIKGAVTNGDYYKSSVVHCGINVADVDKCLSMGHSRGGAIIPEGSHKVAIQVWESTRAATMPPYTSALYKVEKYCPPVW